MTRPGGALIATILFIPLSAAEFNLEADWAEAGMQVILRHCPICSQDSIVGHGHRRKERAVGLPKPTPATVFEIVATGKVYRVTGAALQRWIVQKRSTWNGPKGYLFCQRPGLE